MRLIGGRGQCGHLDGTHLGMYSMALETLERDANRFADQSCMCMHICIYRRVNHKNHVRGSFCASCSTSILHVHDNLETFEVKFLKSVVTERDTSRVHNAACQSMGQD